MMSYDEIYSEYKNMDKDQYGNMLRIYYTENIKEWLNREGQLNKEVGPAQVYSDGSRKWLRNGARHREDGPALIGKGGG